MNLSICKPALFAQLGYVPHKGQLLVHRSKAKRRVLCTGSRWGKSLCAAMEAVTAAMEPKKRSMGWCVGPTLELADKVFREIVIVVAEHLKHRLVELKQHDKKIVLRNLGGGLSEIRGKTADNPVGLLGEGLDWLIMDECPRASSLKSLGGSSSRGQDRSSETSGSARPAPGRNPSPT